MSLIPIARLTVFGCRLFDATATVDCPKGRKTWSIARLKAQVANWQFHNLYGHPSARISRFHSYQVEVADPSTLPKGEKGGSRTTPGEDKDGPGSFLSLWGKWIRFSRAWVAILLQICCFILFDTPDTHNSALETIWVDKIVIQARVQYLIDRTIKDWGDAILLSTVLWT